MSKDNGWSTTDRVYACMLVWFVSLVFLVWVGYNIQNVNTMTGLGSAILLMWVGITAIIALSGSKKNQNQ